MKEMRFMLDIETTGLNPKTDDILEIGIMAITRNPGGLWTYHKHWNMVLASAKTPNPEDKFAMEHMQALYEMSNNVHQTTGKYDDPAELRSAILSFIVASLHDSGVVDLDGVVKPMDIVMCGWNVATFDLPFMVEKGYLSPKDYSYRIHEQSGGVHLAMAVLDYHREKLLDQVKMHQMLPGGDAVRLEGMGKHRALWDCVDQAKTENALIRMLKVKTNPTELEPT